MNYPSVLEEGRMTPSDVQLEQHMFDMIKMWCSGRPNLVKKLVHWGLSKDPEPGIPIKISPQKIKKLASGRLWVSCMLDKPPSERLSGEISSEQDALDNLKGAYQEIEMGSEIYLQPRPELNQPGMQHRLRKEGNFWVIEERDQETQTWGLRVKEQFGRWLDLRYVYQPVRIKVIPLNKILERMTDHIFDGGVEKQLDFLFRECNQKKLNTKLRKRNLEHNIQNIKLKLKKQHCLSFAVRVAKVADMIAKEHGIYG
jgi:hypothetical protein